MVQLKVGALALPWLTEDGSWCIKCHLSGGEGARAVRAVELGKVGLTSTCSIGSVTNLVGSFPTPELSMVRGAGLVWAYF